MSSWASSSSGTWYCQVHRSAGNGVLWTCPNQRRRPLYNIVWEKCNMRRMSLFRMWSRLNTPRIPRSILTSVVAIFLLLFTFIAQHSLPYVKAGMSMASYTLRSSAMTPYCFWYDPICTCNVHFARSSAYSSSHGSSDSISWDILHIHIIRSWLRRMLPHWLSVVLSDYWLDIHSHQLRNQNSYYIQQIRTIKHQEIHNKLFWAEILEHSSCQSSTTCFHTPV